MKRSVEATRNGPEGNDVYGLKTVDHGVVVGYDSDRPVEAARSELTRIGTASAKPSARAANGRGFTIRIEEMLLEDGVGIDGEF